MAMPDLQRNPWNRYQIINVEDIVAFIDIKVLLFENM